MKKSTKLIIAGADGPTSMFLAAEIPGDEKQAEYTSISLEEAKEAFSISCRKR